MAGALAGPTETVVKAEVSGGDAAADRTKTLSVEYLLRIHPLVLGSGRRLLADGAFASLRFVDAQTTTTGVVIAT